MAKIDIPVQVNIPVEEVIEYLKKGGTLVDVVRCKDCLWRGDDEYCDKHGFQNATDEFFCASGRKEQDDAES